ncbi:MAG: MBL fold metallo-hydrolase [Chloroflexota bacterium]|nr:MBL fold metallo-hydrolase [Chloroflexota bacterium]
MSIRITTLSENAAKSGFIAEWGLSVLIEADDLRILLDTSQSFSVVHNAQALGFDLSIVDKLVLSHGHYDHTGGLREVLSQTGEIDIIAHPDIWQAKCAVRNNIETPIGIPFTRGELEQIGARFQMTTNPVWITDNIVTTGEVPMVTEYEQIDSNLFVRDGEILRPDLLLDDLALAIKTEKGLVVILGCGHRGMVNTIWHLQRITGEKRVNCVLGGTHLIAASPERLALTVADLSQIGIEKLGVCHCTGFGASCRLANEFPNSFVLNNAGTIMMLP